MPRPKTKKPFRYILPPLLPCLIVEIAPLLPLALLYGHKYTLKPIKQAETLLLTVEFKPNLKIIANALKAETGNPLFYQKNLLGGQMGGQMGGQTKQIYIGNKNKLERINLLKINIDIPIFH